MALAAMLACCRGRRRSAVQRRCRKKVANQTCAACHGADGNSQIAVNPKLAGQIPEYLNKQLANFKAAAGKKAERENPVMVGMVANLSTDDMRNLAAYYASQAAKPAREERIWSRWGENHRGTSSAGCRSLRFLRSERAGCRRSSGQP